MGQAERKLDAAHRAKSATMQIAPLRATPLGALDFGQCLRHLALKMLWHLLPSRSSNLAEIQRAKWFHLIGKRSKPSLWHAWP